MQREAVARHMAPEEHREFLEAQRKYFEIVRDLVRFASGSRSGKRATVDAFAVIGICDRVSVWYRPDGRLTAPEVADLTWAAVRRLVSR
jgi:hypothetical protein